MMGLFPEIGRAWFTIDSEIYVSIEDNFSKHYLNSKTEIWILMFLFDQIWTYEHARDVAYYDGLNHVIVSVGLVIPKPGVFISEVKYLLILTTPIEIIILGVTFDDTTKTISSPNRSSINQNSGGGTSTTKTSYQEMQLMSKPIFILSTDNVAIATIEGSNDGRIFLGGRDGCLYEVYYQAESSWFGKRSKKINHSQSIVSYMIPNFLKVFSVSELENL